MRRRIKWDYNNPYTRIHMITISQSRNFVEQKIKDDISMHARLADAYLKVKIKKKKHSLNHLFPQNRLEVMFKTLTPTFEYINFPFINNIINMKKKKKFCAIFLDQNSNDIWILQQTLMCKNKFKLTPQKHLKAKY